MNERLFCEIYVNASDSEEIFTDAISALVGGKRLGYELHTNWAIIDVITNDEFGTTFNETGDDFLGYRYKLEFELESDRQVARSEYIGNVGALLTKLWRRGYKAVAACNFEEELPRHGGYKEE